MYVRLLRYTEDPERTVALAARLCYSPVGIGAIEKKLGPKETRRLVRMLIKMGHESALEHASFTFGIEGISRCCSHQLVRHRLASYSQQSQRYVGEHSAMHGGVFDFVIPPSVVEIGYEDWFREKMAAIQVWYDELVTALGNRGEASNEDARFILPNAAETKIVVTMNSRELLHFFRVRTCNRAQWEIRALAIEMLRHVKAVAPHLFAKAGPACYTDRCREGKLSCGRSDAVRARLEALSPPAKKTATKSRSAEGD
jgi:thymidylate synthase (FAD)